MSDPSPAAMSDVGPLHGQVHAITGALGGVGRHVVDLFHLAGARLVLVDRPAAVEALTARADALGPAVSHFAADLTTRADAEALVQHALATHGRLDGVAHTVGGFAMGPLGAATDADLEAMLDLNLRATFHTLVAALPHLEASPAGFFAAFGAGPAVTGSAPNMALYGASKAAMATLLRSLDGETTSPTLRVALVHPMGAIDTPTNRAAMPDVAPESWIAPADLAEALLFAATRSPRGRVTELPVHPPRTPPA